MQKLIVLGAGTFAVEVTDLVEDIGGYEIIGYCVDRKGPVAVEKDRLISLVDLMEFNDRAWNKEVQFIGAMVSTERNEFIEAMLGLGFEPTTVIHPSASISKTAIVLPGAIINRQVAIGAYAGIGSHTIINRGATIGHHTSIGPYSTIGPGANIAGQCSIGARVMVGMGALIVEKTIVPDSGRVRAGVLVTN